jgi:hypothetical protein
VLPATKQAGEFVREEFHHVREGIHGVRSAKQAIAIGLSKSAARPAFGCANEPETLQVAIRRENSMHSAYGRRCALVAPRGQNGASGALARRMQLSPLQRQ